ncbi:MAG: hypothetical protein HQK51_11410 [Oligoflexia bacterium]|nr:hypothetical protein [Oligoflexia bacterium]
MTVEDFNTKNYADPYVSMIVFTLQMVVSIYAVAMFITCRGQFSIKISSILFMLASVLYIAEEIYSYSTLKNINTKLANLLVTMDNAQSQIDTVQAQLDSTNELKKALDVKKGLLLAVMAADIAAAVAVLVEAIADCWSKGAACLLADMECSSMKVGSLPVKANQQMLTQSSSKIFQKQFFTSLISSSFADNIEKGSDSQEDNEIIAGTLKLVGFVGVALRIAYMIHYIYKKNGCWKIAMYPLTRFLYYAVVASLHATYNFVFLIPKIKDVEKRVTRLEEILASLNKLKGSKRDKVKGNKSSLAKSQLEGEGGMEKELESDKDPASNTGCLNASRVPPVKDEKCACKEKGTCAPKIPSKVQSLTSFPDSALFTTVFNSLKNATTEATHGNIKGAIAASAPLISPAAKIKKNMGKYQNKLNDLLKSKKMKPIDFDAQAKKLQNNLIGQARQALKNAGITNSQMENATNSLMGEDLIKTDPNKKDGGTGSSGSSGVGQPIVNGGAGSGAGSGGGAAADAKLEEKNEFNFSEDQKTDEAGLAVGADTKKEANINEFEEKYNDIHGNSSESIFKIISSRYVRTAYPKLLEKEK